MDQGLYTQIIDESAESGCKEIHLHNFGEPLLDRHLEDKIRYAKQQGLSKVKIFTNGSLLNAARSQSLIQAGLDEIKISIDGAGKEEFERIRFPLKFDRVVQNIKHLVANKQRLQSPLRIAVACCSTSDMEGTIRQLEGIVDRFSFGKLHNWGGERRPVGRWRVRKPCTRLWRTFTILANGDVALCCLDYDGQFILGRLDEGTTIREIWNSPAYRKVRRLHRLGQQEEISLCGHCSKSYLFASSPPASEEPEPARRAA
jgi:radical SAM protein with 4Fe4S-binding SPASM domain